MYEQRTGAVVQNCHIEQRVRRVGRWRETKLLPLLSTALVETEVRGRFSEPAGLLPGTPTFIEADQRKSERLEVPV